MKERQEKKPKILFIALAHSSHTASWIKLLLGSGMDVRLWGIGKTEPCEDTGAQVYSFYRQFPERSPATNWWQRVFSDTAVTFLKHIWISLDPRKKRFVQALLEKVVGPLSALKFLYRYGELPDIEGRWLTEVIKEFRPDIIHTLGLESAGFLFFDTKEKVAGYFGKWITTVRGSELTLKGYLPAEQIQRTLSACDRVIVDSPQSQKIALRYCNDVHRFPGTGGIDIPQSIPAKKERMILWPKGYEFWGSKSLPVIEAFIMAWERIRPCRICLTAVDLETRRRIEELPDNIRESIYMHGRIPRDELLSLMARARVMLAPSLSDGIPNVLYEAMAYGALPIVSPLETIQGVAIDGENALFARNLYPEEIARAIVRALTDDDLFLSVQRNNREKVRAVADRTQIAKDVRDMYLALMCQPHEESVRKIEGTSQ